MGGGQCLIADISSARNWKPATATDHRSTDHRSPPTNHCPLETDLQSPLNRPWRTGCTHSRSQICAVKAAGSEILRVRRYASDGALRLHKRCWLRNAAGPEIQQAALRRSRQIEVGEVEQIERAYARLKRDAIKKRVLPTQPHIKSLQPRQSRRILHR